MRRDGRLEVVHVHGSSVSAPQRDAVLEGLDVLAARMPDLEARPDLPLAIHWILDDTQWEGHDPAVDVGYLLRDEREATCIRALVARLRALRMEHGVATESAYYTDPGWPLIRALAHDCRTVLLTPSDLDAAVLWILGQSAEEPVRVDLVGTREAWVNDFTYSYDAGTAAARITTYPDPATRHPSQRFWTHEVRRIRNAETGLTLLERPGADASDGMDR